MKMSKSLFTGRTASRTKSQTEQWFSSAPAPKHAASMSFIFGSHENQDRSLAQHDMYSKESLWAGRSRSAL